MRRTDIVRRETLDYTEFYWWKDDLKTDADFEALRKKDQADQGKKK